MKSIKETILSSKLEGEIEDKRFWSREGGYSSEHIYLKGRVTICDVTTENLHFSEIDNFVVTDIAVAIIKKELEIMQEKVKLALINL